MAMRLLISIIGAPIGPSVGKRTKRDARRKDSRRNVHPDC
jgi:hypothetical protein